MAVQETMTPQHWNYFLALDDDIAKLSRYIEPVAANFAAYSLEMARILLAAASEVDVVAKQICTKLDPGSRARNIRDYQEAITGAYPDLCDAVVLVPRFGLVFMPWKRWAEGQSPEWWTANTDVKHKRHTNFRDANLENTLSSVAALFVLLLYFYPDEAMNGVLHPDPTLFRVGKPFYTGFPAWGRQVTLYSRDPLDLWSASQGHS